MPKVNRTSKHKLMSKIDNESEDSDNYENTLPVSEDSEESQKGTPIPDEIIYPGLVLKDNYILLKKIGHGNNATVWMSYRFSNKKFIAIKVQDYQCYNDGCREVAIIKKINTYCKENPSKSIYCVNMLDFFVYEEDNNTKFVCSVYELFAGSIQMLLDTGKYKYGLPIPIVKKIIRQLLVAVSTLHNNLKIIHTDIKPENILFKGVPDYQNEVIELFERSGFQKKYEILSSTYSNDKIKFREQLEILALESVKEICTLESNDDGDEELIPDEEDFDEDDIIEGDNDSDSYDSEDDDFSNECYNERNQSIDDIIEHLDYTCMHDLSVEGGYDFNSVLNNRENSTDKVDVIDKSYVTNCETALTDFGNSYFFEKRTRNEIQDRRYRAPEVVLDLNYGYASDIWSVACVTFELLTGFVLFEPEETPINKDIHHLYLMETMLGQIPLKMKKSSKRNRFLFDRKRNYHIKNVEKFPQHNLKDRLTGQFLFSENDAAEISDFLVCGLKYIPTDRWSARDMLNHPWLKNEI